MGLLERCQLMQPFTSSLKVQQTMRSGTIAPRNQRLAIIGMRFHENKGNSPITVQSLCSIDNQLMLLLNHAHASSTDYGLHGSRHKHISTYKGSKVHLLYITMRSNTQILSPVVHNQVWR